MMKTLMFFLAAVLLALGPKQKSSALNIFGPGNYEECVADGKVGRSRTEIAVQMSACRKKFPVLRKIKKNKLGEIKCSTTEGTVWNVRIQEKAVYIFEKFELKITAKTEETINFEGQTDEQKGYKRVKLFGSLYMNNGDLIINIIDHKTSKQLESIYLSCAEE